MEGTNDPGSARVSEYRGVLLTAILFVPLNKQALVHDFGLHVVCRLLSPFPGFFCSFWTSYTCCIQSVPTVLSEVASRVGCSQAWNP